MFFRNIKHIQCTYKIQVWLCTLNHIRVILFSFIFGTRRYCSGSLSVIASSIVMRFIAITDAPAAHEDGLERISEGFHLVGVEERVNSRICM